MRESEEGQYIPVSSASGQVIQNALRTTTAIMNMNSVSSDVKALRAKSVEPNVAIESKPVNARVETTASLSVRAPQVQQSPVTVIARPRSPLVPPAVPAVSVANVQPPKPTSLKAHVLNSSKLQASQSVHAASVAKTLNVVTSVTSSVVQPSLQPMPSLQQPAVPQARNVTSPGTQHMPQHPAVSAVNALVPGKPMSPVLRDTAGAPPNPKQHLLQAAKLQQSAAIVSVPSKVPVNLHPDLTSPLQRSHVTPQPPISSSKVVVNSQQPHPLNPKAHLLQVVVPSIVPGTVSSPPAQPAPHLGPPQPVVTVGSSNRPNITKSSVSYLYFIFIYRCFFDSLTNFLS